MTAPNNSFDNYASRLTRQARDLAQTTFYSSGLRGAELETSIAKSVAVFTRLLESQKDFLNRGATPFESTALAVIQDFNLVKNGCGNPKCPTDRENLLFQSSLKKCARCLAMLYCSRECQKAHWKTHKPNCTPPHKTEEKT